MNNEFAMEDMLDEIFDLGSEIKSRLWNNGSEEFIFKAVCDIQHRSTVIKQKCYRNDSGIRGGAKAAYYQA